MTCRLCGDEAVCYDIATSSDPFLLMVVEATRADWKEHLRLEHPQEWERAERDEREMNEAFARIFGGRQ